MNRAFYLILPLALLASCGQQKAGEPVVTVNLKEENGEEIVPVLTNAPVASVDESVIDSACETAIFEEVSLTHFLC